jgi:hypothetical protein
MYSRQSHNRPVPSRGDGANVLYLVLSVLATCITPLIRTGFGVEALGTNGLLATLLLLVISPSVPDMPGYFALWLFALVMQRLITLRNARRGLIVHSRYAGYPWLAMKMPLVRKESTAIRIAEPLVCLGLGGLIYLGSPLFGQLIMICAMALFLKGLVEKWANYARIQRVRDAEIEQRWYAEQFRKGVK